MRDKHELRKQLRRNITENVGDSSAVIDAVVMFLERHSDRRTIALFSPLLGEVDLLPVITKLQKRWVFPKVRERQLEFYEVKNLASDLEKGAFGILEPRKNLDLMPVKEIDVFLCPGLGFDPHGGRIGRGKGFYDGVLSEARANALKVGVCFSHQIVDEIIMEPHDVRMDHVLFA